MQERLRLLCLFLLGYATQREDRKLSTKPDKETKETQESLGLRSVSANTLSATASGLTASADWYDPVNTGWKRKG